MNNRLKAWVGFNDGNCDEDTQMLIDDVKELGEKLKNAVELLYSTSSVPKGVIDELLQ